MISCIFFVIFFTNIFINALAYTKCVHFSYIFFGNQCPSVSIGVHQGRSKGHWWWVPDGGWWTPVAAGLMMSTWSWAPETDSWDGYLRWTAEMSNWDGHLRPAVTPEMGTWDASRRWALVPELDTWWAPEMDSEWCLRWAADGRWWTVMDTDGHWWTVISVSFFV